MAKLLFRLLAVAITWNNHPNMLNAHFNLTDTARNVDHWSFFSETETCWHREHDANRLDDESPLAKVTSDDESTEDCFNL